MSTETRFAAAMIDGGFTWTTGSGIDTSASRNEMLRRGSGAVCGPRSSVSTALLAASRLIAAPAK